MVEPAQLPIAGQNGPPPAAAATASRPPTTACPCLVTVLVAAQMTGLPRKTDPESSREKKKTIQQLMQARVSDDANFRNQAAACEQRMRKSGRFVHHQIVVARPTTGLEHLAVLENASSWGQIKNLICWGHSGPYAIYGKDDAGFYRNPGDVNGTPEAQSVNELREKVKTSKTIVFADEPLVMLCGCKTAGDGGIDVHGLAAWFAEATGATVIGSVNPSDQSLKRSDNFVFSTKHWTRFPNGSRNGQAMTAADTKSGDVNNIDVLAHLRP